MQKGDVGRGGFHVHEKVGARKAEEHRQLVRMEQQRVDVQLALGVPQKRYGERMGTVAVDELANDVSALVTEEERAQHLDLTVGLDAQWPRQVGTHGEDQAAHVALSIDERAGQSKIVEEPAEARAQTVLQRVVGAKRRRIRIQ